uniref:Uncharacterized protein n=1 Tax=Romanomermis culicivorax TaxID=13658 RepID=A0A915K8M2_ROMCU
MLTHKHDKNYYLELLKSSLIYVFKGDIMPDVGLCLADFLRQNYPIMEYLSTTFGKVSKLPLDPSDSLDFKLCLEISLRNHGQRLLAEAKLLMMEDLGGKFGLPLVATMVEEQQIDTKLGSDKADNLQIAFSQLLPAIQRINDSLTLPFQESDQTIEQRKVELFLVASPLLASVKDSQRFLLIRRKMRKLVENEGGITGHAASKIEDLEQLKSKFRVKPFFELQKVKRVKVKTMQGAEFGIYNDRKLKIIKTNSKLNTIYHATLDRGKAYLIQIHQDDRDIELYNLKDWIGRDSYIHNKNN